MAGLSWSFRTGASGHNDGTTGSDRDQLGEFWAISTNILTNDVITESISGCASFQYGGEYYGLIVFGVSGANLGAPFDPNVSLAASASGFGTPSVTLSTSNTNDLLIGGGQIAASTPQGCLSAGPGFTMITSMNGGNEAVEEQLLTSAASGYPVSFGSNTGYWEIIADSIQRA